MTLFAFTGRVGACFLRGDSFSKALLPKAAFAIALSLVFSSQSANAADDPPCQLHRVASLDMQLDKAGVPVVPVTIAGQAKSLVVDIGTTFSALTETKARAMNLKFEPVPKAFVISRFDGTIIHSQAFAPGFMVGQIPLPNYTFMILPDNQVAAEDDGVLGADIFTHFDVELDFAKSKLNFFLPNKCGDRVVYWRAPYARLPITFSNQIKRIHVNGEVDGVPLGITINTGSPVSTMGMLDAKGILGWRSPPPGLKKEGQRNGDDIYSYTFKTLKIGGITISNPKVLIFDGPAVAIGTYGINIGMDILSQLHTYIAYPEQALYVTSAPGPAPNADAYFVPSAGGYFSAGRAAMQKGDYDGAITAFSAALARDPTIVGAYLNRGEAYAHKKEYDLAVADDTQTLTMNSTLFNAFDARCYHRVLWRQDLDKALDDCNAALKLSPKQADVLDSRGSVYFQMGKFDLAKADFDSSIESRSSPATLYKRGIAKNRLGDAAGGNADIDAALKKDPHAGDEMARMGVQPQ